MAKDIKRYTLCDTSYIPTYDEYVENCEINEIESEGENSDAYWDFVSDMQSMEYDDLEMNLKHSEQANQPVLITGTLGLWDGSHEINPVRCESVWSAIQKCSGSVEHIKVEYENGVVYVTGTHHDGTNQWEIHKLSKKGIISSDSWFGHIAPTESYKGYWLAKFHGFLY